MKRKLVYLVSFALLIVLAFCLNTYAKTDFPDTQGHWAKGSIDLLVEKGIITGYPSGNFGPDDTLNRSAFVTMVIKGLGYKQLRCEEGDHWAQPYIDLATEFGLIDYLSISKYDQPIPRQEMAKIAVRALKLKEYPSYVSAYEGIIKDFDSISVTYQDEIVKSLHLGLLTGYSNGNFAPLDSCTRAQASIVVNRIIDPSMRENSKVIFSTRDYDFERLEQNEKYYDVEGIKIVDDGRLTFKGISSDKDFFLPNFQIKNSNEIAYKMVAQMVKLAKEYNGYVKCFRDYKNESLVLKYYSDPNKTLDNENLTITFFYGKEALDPQTINGSNGYRILWSLSNLYPRPKYLGYSQDNQVHPEMENVTKTMLKVLYDEAFTNELFEYMAEKYSYRSEYYAENLEQYKYIQEDLIGNRNIYTNVKGWVLFYTKMP